MEITKKIEFVMAPQGAHWVGDGFNVHNFIPSQRGLGMKDTDPFIMLDYNAPMQVQPHDIPRGVGVHPHRGFETVTIAYAGQVEHHDSSGGGGIIGTGDVQWMTAASGVLHKEYYAREWAKQGGLFQMVQLWTNLPAKDKMAPPTYQAIKAESMGRYPLPDTKSTVEIIAGSYMGIAGPAKTHSPINMMNAKLAEGAVAEFNFPEHYNTLVLVIKGNVRVNDTEVKTDHLVKFTNSGERFTIEGLSPESIALVLSGEPLNEPISAYGPFVMNTQGEIRQAVLDYNMGKFGYLED